ncbi:hypothetical protein ACTXG7_09175 [Mycolicibacterium sp. Dal123E01]|uniref:hypothetical protein n=1 Tax=Mycolicibacterium sp. Dal123E01 TaxID=3457578 RepID=UPI00403EBB7D
MSSRWTGDLRRNPGDVRWNRLWANLAVECSEATVTGEKQRRSVKPYISLGLGLIMVLAGWLQHHLGGGWPGIVGMVAGAVFVVQAVYELARRRLSNR